MVKLLEVPVSDKGKYISSMFELNIKDISHATVLSKKETNLLRD